MRSNYDAWRLTRQWNGMNNIARVQQLKVAFQDIVKLVQKFPSGKGSITVREEVRAMTENPLLHLFLILKLQLGPGELVPDGLEIIFIYRTDNCKKKKNFNLLLFLYFYNFSRSSEHQLEFRRSGGSSVPWQLQWWPSFCLCACAARFALPPFQQR